MDTLPATTQRPLPEIAPIRRADISEITYERIRELILRGNLEPGSKIDVDYLANSLQVSRTTVANALQRLALEELAFIVPRRGTFVQRFTVRDLRELYDVRLCLELWAARLSVESASEQEVSGLRDLLLGFQPLFEGQERKDMVSFASQNRDFHTYLVGLAHNSRLLSIYQSLNIDVLGSTVYRQADALRPARTVFAEHEAIVLAYEARDRAAAEATISAHLTTARDSHSKAFAAQGMPD